MQGNTVQQLPGAQLLASVVPRPNAAAMANLGLPSNQGNGMGAYTQQQLQQLSQMQGKQWAVPYIHVRGTGIIVASVSQSVSQSVSDVMPGSIWYNPLCISLGIWVGSPGDVQDFM